MKYDCIIIGGGIAGLQASIQLGRYMHKILVIDSDNGRSNICQSYHNILGYPNGISGKELREIGRKQAEGLGVAFVNEKAESAKKEQNHFLIITDQGNTYESKLLMLATGVMDKIPPLKGLQNCLGKSVYVCPDCDGYEVKDQKVVVIGSGKYGAHMALTLSYWTKEIIYINHEQAPIVESTLEELKKKQIKYINTPVKEVLEKEGHLEAVILEDNSKVEANHAFIAFGGCEVKSSLAKQLGVELLENKHITVDPRTKMTSVQNVWAGGDVVAHSEQVTIALGDGSQAAIWMHKTLMSEVKK